MRRAYADDLAVVMPRPLDCAGGLEELFSEYAALSGLRLNLGKTVWVPLCFGDPEEFRPERFMKGSPLFENLHPFLLLPFGHGPRMCVGRRFAELEVYTFMTKMIQNFKIEWHQDPLEYKVATLTYPSSPLRFTLIDN